MKGLWLEIDHYQNIQMACSTNTTILQSYIHWDQIFEFLASSTIDFDQVQVQILGKKWLPSLTEVFATVRTEESQQSYA